MAPAAPWSCEALQLLDSDNGGLCFCVCAAGKMRNRRYVLRKGPLVVASNTTHVARAFRNLPGVEVVSVDRLNLLQVRAWAMRWSLPEELVQPRQRQAAAGAVLSSGACSTATLSCLLGGVMLSTRSGSEDRAHLRQHSH